MSTLINLLSVITLIAIVAGGIAQVIKKIKEEADRHHPDDLS